MGIVGFNPQLHPRGAAGRFTVKGSSRSTSTRSTPEVAGRPAAAPNGLGYSDAQWAALQKLEARARAGEKLTAHQKHELHVAHEKRLATLAKVPTTKIAAPKTATQPRRARKA